MTEKIYHQKKLYALIVRAKFRKKKGISFFTPNETNQQFGYMNHDKGYVIKPHKHKARTTKIFYTTEVIIIFKGSLRVDFYDYKQKYLFSKIINEKDIIMLVHGGHGFKVLKKIEMIEVKQGPYSISKDKIKFDEVDEKKIKIKP
jgi:hypothetical protein|tara:strand:+ start:694 stop:1128 length:435 start_codon:yes stop_codon:yes gene_type:complete